MKKYIVFTCIVFFVAACSQQIISKSRASNQFLTSDAKIRTGMLDNGLCYFIRHNAKPENEVEFRLVVNVGSLLERDEERGAAHFVEHMAFNGTEHFSRNEIIEFLRSSGMQFGPDVNAYTSRTKTVYRFSLPADRTGLLDQGFLILKDWACGQVFNENEVENEKSIIVEEWRARKGARERIWHKILPQLFDAYYAGKEPIGSMDVVSTITADQLKSFYKQWYRPELMTIVVVGDMNIDEIEAQIKSLFADLTNGNNRFDINAYKIPEHKDTRLLKIMDVEQSQSILRIYQKYKRTKLLTEYDFQQLLTERLYGFILNMRFTSQDLGSYFRYPLTRDDASHVIQVSVKNNDYESSLRSALEELERLRRYGIHGTELQRAKSAILRGAKAAYIERDNLESSTYANAYIQNALREEPIISPELRYELTRKFLPAIQIQDVNMLRNRFNVSSNRLVVCLGNQSTSSTMPDMLEFNRIVKEVKSEYLPPYADDVSSLPFFTEQVIKGRIEQEIFYETSKVTLLHLSNGIRVVLKPTEFKNDEILFNVYSPGGLSLADSRFIPMRHLAPSVFQQSGIGPFTGADLAKRLASHKIQANIFIDAYEEGAWGSVVPDDLELLLQLIHLGFSQPRFDLMVFENEREKLVNIVSKIQKTADWKFEYLLGEKLFNGNPYALPLNATHYKALQGKPSQQFFKERFDNPADFTFQFVGSFDMETIKRLIEKYLASLSTSANQETVKDLEVYPVAGQHRFEINENLEDKSQVVIHLHHAFRFSERRFQEFLSLYNLLDICIQRDIREKMGLIYSGTIFFSFVSEPKPYSFFRFSFTCDPNNVDRVITALKSILEQLRQDPVSDELFLKSVQSQQRTMERKLTSNKGWANSLKTLVSLDQDVDTILDYKDYLMHLTPAVMQASAQKYLNDENFFVVVMNPKQ